MKRNDSRQRLRQNNSLGDWLKKASTQLRPVTDTPVLESQMIASHILGKSISWIIGHPEINLGSSIIKRMNVTLGSLMDGCPFAYITGQREFYNRSIDVRPGLLVPRPETELMVEKAIRWLLDHPDRRSAVDVGCGTGCIAVTLAAEIPDLIIDAIDVDPLAAQVTTQNAIRHNVQDRVATFSGNLLSAIQRQYDLICANLPYIPTETVTGLSVARYEPVLALDGGSDGLRLIEMLLQQSVERLRPDGLILLEIEESQGITAPALAQQYFPSATILLNRDLAGLPRIVSIQRKENEAD